MIVVDTNVIAYFWLPGEYTTFAERALNKDNEWAAPILWRSEFRNILPGWANSCNLRFCLMLILPGKDRRDR